jgi:hypothetical protein
VLSVLFAATVLAAIIINGNFETGTLAGWTVVNQTGGSGDWFAYRGTISPVSGMTIAAPPEGNFAATTDQTGPGSHILYQVVTLDDATPFLTFILYYKNSAAGFATPDSLDYAVVPNQQYRVDIVDPAAPVNSVADADVLMTVFRTEVGDPLTLAPTLMAVDVSSLSGLTVRIRFAEVDNQGFFQASVDDVRCVEAAPAGAVSPRLTPAQTSSPRTVQSVPAGYGAR